GGPRDARPGSGGGGGWHRSVPGRAGRGAAGAGAGGARRGSRGRGRASAAAPGLVEIQKWRPASLRAYAPALERERRTDERAARAGAEPRERDVRASAPSYGGSRSRRLRRVTKRVACSVSAVPLGEISGVASGGCRVGAVRARRAGASSASPPSASPPSASPPSASSSAPSAGALSSSAEVVLVTGAA